MIDQNASPPAVWIERAFVGGTPIELVAVLVLPGDVVPGLVAVVARQLGRRPPSFADSPAPAPPRCPRRRDRRTRRHGPRSRAGRHRGACRSRRSCQRRRHLTRPAPSRRGVSRSPDGVAPPAEARTTNVMVLPADRAEPPTPPTSPEVGPIRDFAHLARCAGPRCGPRARSPFSPGWGAHFGDTALMSDETSVGSGVHVTKRRCTPF